jgi:hypothetical protein
MDIQTPPICVVFSKYNYIIALVNDNYKKEGETMKLSYYKNGTKVKIGGIVWTILSKSDSGILCITSPIVEYGVFCQKPRENNNWETSDAREYLNGEFLDKLIRGMRVRDENPDDIIEQTIDLTTDDGLKDYGSCKDKIFLLTC